MEGIGGGAGYALGHSPRELERLSAQARVFGPFTRRMLQEAGVSEGMRVLDVGSGTGDVAFICASLVGSSGVVVGVDKAEPAVSEANERARADGFGNVTFAVGDPGKMCFEEPFDAVVGRLVLMHQPDPVAMLRSLASLLKGRGVVAFQEFDITSARCYPPVRIYEQCIEWINAAFGRTGTDSRMGMKLHASYVAAGLPAPSMSVDAGIWAGENSPVAKLVTDVIRSLLPVLVQSGIATAAEVDINSLQERIQKQLLANGSVAISPSLVGCWTRVL